MTNPPSANTQMQQLAEEAVKVAAEKFGQSLDYTENSLAGFEALLQQAYELYSSTGSGNNIPEDTIQKTARVWGSYLGELMRRKWGGEWVVNGSEVNLTISGKSCSPIQQIFRRITIGQLYDTKEFFEIFASDMAEPKGKQEAQASNDTTVDKRIDLLKPKVKQETQALNEIAVDDKIEKAKESIVNVISAPADPKREQAAQALNELAVSEQIDLLRALLTEQKEQAKILKAIRGRLGNPVANIIILILVLSGIAYLIYFLMI